MAGACALDWYLAGNGDTSATVQLTGPTGSVVLALEIGESGLVRRSEGRNWASQVTELAVPVSLQVPG